MLLKNGMSAPGSPLAAVSRRRVTGLIVSLALHGFLLLMLAFFTKQGVQRSPKAEEGRDVVAFHIQATPNTRERPDVDPERHVMPPSSTHAANARAKANSRLGKPSHKSAAAGPSAAPAPGAPIPASPTAPAEAPGVLVPPSGILSMRPPDLMVSPDRVGSLQQGVAVDATPRSSPAPEKGRRHRFALDRKDVDSILKEGEGQRNIEQGRVSPEVYDYLREARKSFAPTLARLEKETGDIKFGAGVKSFYRDWLKGVRISNHEVPQKLPPLAAGAATSDEAIDVREDGGAALEAAVCLSSKAGSKTYASILRSSGSEAFDQEAESALLRAIRVRPEDALPLPPNAPPGRTSTRACYEFLAKARRIPLSLTPLACTFDPLKMKASCVYPFKKAFSSRIRLVSVEYLKD